MAVLANADFQAMWQDVFRVGHGKDQFKGANPSLSGDAVRAVLQRLEDIWEANRATLKGQMDTAAGTTLTAAQAKVLARAWLAHKARSGN